MSVRQQAVEQCISDGRVAQVFVPATDRELAGDKRRTRAVTVFNNFQEVVPFCLGERLQAEVVEDEHVCLSECDQTLAVRAIAAGET